VKADNAHHLFTSNTEVFFEYWFLLVLEFYLSIWSTGKSREEITLTPDIRDGGHVRSSYRYRGTRQMCCRSIVGLDFLSGMGKEKIALAEAQRSWPCITHETRHTRILSIQRPDVQPPPFDHCDPLPDGITLV
jgi:hypothetical protein